MFDFTETFEIHPSKVVVTAVDGAVIRRCRFKLERTFDDETAKGMGPTARCALDLVADSRVSRVVIPLDAVQAEMKFKGASGEVTIGKATGLKAICRAPKVPKNEDEDPGPPTVTLEWETGISDDFWMFLGRNAGDAVEVTCRKNQLELALEGPPAARANGSGGGAGGGGSEKPADGVKAADGEAPRPTLKPPKGKKALRTRSSHGQDRAEAAGEIDPQKAGSPEEAERVREQRLREERALEERVWNDDEPEQKAAGAIPTEPLAF